jgi:cytoskeletal protein CcmA (bactofilin family)
MSLWQKPENEPAPPAKVGHTPAPTYVGSSSSEHRSTSGLANIGQSVHIKGELTGNENLTVDGRIEGKINLKDHHLTIGPNGHITAEVHAKTVVVNGAVLGNIHADDKVEIAPSGSVEGDIRAPRVALADGSSFKGSIDMGKAASASKSGASAGARQHEVAMSARGAER